MITSVARLGGRLKLRIVRIRNSQPLNLVCCGRARVMIIYFEFMQRAWKVGGPARVGDDAEEVRGSFVMLVL